ncbi:zinc finger protein 34-like [Cylas formicarius]|uniref:zinc finger protein 34-like n=1 Tax=Cylas formicarius TaxID=197179 RepID=UPI0029588244|nr:zinc finger protein 34-like [Cylas formicarius]
MAKARNCYIKYSLQTKCRICLTQSWKTGTDLTSPMNSKADQVTVAAALEDLMGERVPIAAAYPSTVCGMCLGLLNIASDLKVQFKENQKVIADVLGEVEPQVVREKEPQAPVELVVGGKTYDIKNLLIVEEENENETLSNFDGFLRNLGNTITATFVNKHAKPSKLVCETKVKIKRRPTSYVLQNKSKTDYVIVPNSEEELDSNEIDRDGQKQLNLNIKPENLGLFSETERDLINSAMNMVYSCMYCKKPYTSLARLKTHLGVCGKISSLRCPLCNKKFIQKKFLTYHIRKVHLTVQNSTDIKESNQNPLKCTTCGTVCRSYSNLNYHRIKHKGKQCACDTCDKKFYTRSQLAFHKQIHSKKETRVLCPICGKSCYYQSGLFYHMKVHTDQKNFQCSYCDRRFFYSASLKRHERTHTNERPFLCKFCGKGFRSIDEKKKHEYIHTGERPYQCDYCDKGFTKTFSLQVHLMTHTGNYECEICHRGFVTPKVVEFHIKHKHRVKDGQEECQEDQVESPVNTFLEGEDKAEEYVIEMIANEDELENYQEIHEFDIIDEATETQFINPFE